MRATRVAAMNSTSSPSQIPPRLVPLVDVAVREARKFVVIFFYLWVLFGLFALHKSILLPDEGIIYGQGFAVVNAFVLAKVMLVADNLHVGENFETRPLLYAVLFRSALFAIILVCFDLIEEVVVGTLRSKTISESIDAIGGGTLEGILSIGVIMFVVLIPFFAFREMTKVVGSREMRELLFVRRTKLGPVATHSARSE
jgi:hypothetical protein